MNIKIGKNIFLPFIALSKPIITLSVAFSALTGFILYSGSFSNNWYFMYLGVLLIAAGSSSLNQVQEANLDKLMDRTRNRPIPSKKISRKNALIFSLVLAVSGASILWWLANPLASILSILTLLWYNAIYTPLKRVTPWAILPGALVGAIPPAIGWTAAGGNIHDLFIIYLSFFFFIGQIPHFWLILLRHGDDYKKGGFPSISNTFSKPQISRLTFTWTFATAITALTLPLVGLISSPFFTVAIYFISFILILSFIKMPGLKQPSNVNRAFMIMNVYFLFMMIFIIADALLRNQTI